MKYLLLITVLFLASGCEVFRAPPGWKPTQADWNRAESVIAGSPWNTPRHTELIEEKGDWSYYNEK